MAKRVSTFACKWPAYIMEIRYIEGVAASFLQSALFPSGIDINKSNTECSSIRLTYIFSA